MKHLLAAAAGGLLCIALVAIFDAPQDAPRPHVAAAAAVTAPPEPPTTTAAPQPPAAPETRTVTVEVPGPTIEVTPQACTDLVAQLTTAATAYRDTWAAWVASHPTPTTRDYYEITTQLVNDGNAAYAQLAPLAAACAG